MTKPQADLRGEQAAETAAAGAARKEDWAKREGEQNRPVTACCRVKDRELA